MHMIQKHSTSGLFVATLLQNPVCAGGHERKLGKTAHLATCAFDNDCMYIFAVLPVFVKPQENVNLGSNHIAVSSKATLTLTGTGKPSFDAFANYSAGDVHHRSKLLATLLTMS